MAKASDDRAKATALREKAVAACITRLENEINEISLEHRVATAALKKFQNEIQNEIEIKSSLIVTDPNTPASIKEQVLRAKTDIKKSLDNLARVLGTRTEDIKWRNAIKHNLTIAINKLKKLDGFIESERQNLAILEAAFAGDELNNLKKQSLAEIDKRENGKDGYNQTVKLMDGWISDSDIETKNYSNTKDTRITSRGGLQAIEQQLSQQLQNMVDILKQGEKHAASAKTKTETGTTPDQQRIKDLEARLERLERENQALRNENQTLRAEAEKSKRTASTLPLPPTPSPPPPRR